MKQINLLIAFHLSISRSLMSDSDPGKTLMLNQIEASASGKMKIEVQVETGVATGTYTTRFVQFNSTATPNMCVKLTNPISVAAGVRVRVIRTNKEGNTQDLYSTISGVEN
jgi:Flp pilus assembly protein TadG